MPLITKTYEELVELELAEVNGRLPELDTSSGSEAEVAARTHAMIAHLSQANAEYLSKQIFAQDADEASLVKHAEMAGVSVPKASKAQGLAIVYSSAAASIPVGSQLTHITGKKYKTTEARTTQVADFSAYPEKTVGAYSNEYRLSIRPTTVGMRDGQAFTVGGVRRVIKEVIHPISSVEVYEPFATLPAAGSALSAPYFALVPIESDEVGADKNLDPGVALTISGVSALVETTVFVQELTGGGDDATPDEVRQDVLAARAVRPGGGNEQHYRFVAKSTPGVRVEDAFVYRGIFGAGSVAVVPMGVSGSRYTGSITNRKIRDALVAELPFPDKTFVLSWRPLYPAVDVEVKVRAAVGFDPDARMEGTIASAGTDTSVVLLTAASVVDYEPGDRIVVEVGTDTLGIITNEQRVIASITRSPTETRIVLDQPLSALPRAGGVVYPGGPLWEKIRAEVEGLFDELGPGDTDALHVDGGSRWPRPADAWPAALYPDHLAARIGTVEGVAEVRNVSPAHGSPVVPPPLYRLQLSRMKITWL